VSDQPVVLPYRAEVLRKALHLLALALPVGLVVLGKPTALPILVPLALVALAADWARQRVPPVRAALHDVFAPIMRLEELSPAGSPLVLNGAVWMCVSAAVCALLYPAPVAAAALSMLMTGDAAAALVGRRFGRHRYPGSPKSLEGSLAFFVTALLTGLALAQLPVPGLAEALPFGRLALGALAATVIEAVPFPLNDNVRVPALAGLAMLPLG